MVTLLSFDTPQALEEKGGWLNPETVQHFKNYARICFDHFGDRVKYWFTIHEPQIFAILGYGGKSLAPAHDEPICAPYLAMHHLLQAHAEAYHTYADEFKGRQAGKVGICLISVWFQPIDPESQIEIEAAQRASHFLVSV